jgi:hypothetical protein
MFTYHFNKIISWNRKTPGISGQKYFRPTTKYLNLMNLVNPPINFIHFIQPNISSAHTILPNSVLSVKSMGSFFSKNNKNQKRLRGERMSPSHLLLMMSKHQSGETQRPYPHHKDAKIHASKTPAHYT